MASFKLAAGLDQKVAAMVRDDVEDITEKAASKARKLAPPTKTWITMRDPAVRIPHSEVDGETRPDNLRFGLTAFAWDLEHPGHVGKERNRKGGKSNWDGHRDEIVPGRHSWMLKPGDRTPGHYVQIVNCRCRLDMDPQGIAKLIRATTATIAGTKVQAKVIAEGNYVIQAERGEVYPEAGMTADGTWFMRKTIAAMAI